MNNVPVMVQGVPQPPKTFDLTTTNRTTLLSNTAARPMTVTGISALNDQATATTLLVEWSPDGSTFYSLWRGVVEANAPASMDDIVLPLVLAQNYVLYATVTDANRVHVTVGHSVEP